MQSVDNEKILAISLSLILTAALTGAPVFAAVTDSSATFTEQVGDIDMSKTDSAGSYIHPGLGGGNASPELKSGMPDMSAPAEPGKAMKREGSGGMRQPGIKKHHGYMAPGKSEGSKSKHGGYGHEYKHHGKTEGSKGGHGYSHHGKGQPGYSKGGHDSHGKCPFTHVLRFADKLGLTDDQITQIKMKQIEYKKANIQAEADHEIAHMEMEALVHSESVDEARLRALGNDIIAAKTKKISAMIEAKIAILNILTPEQRKKASGMHGMHH